MKFTSKSVLLFEWMKRQDEFAAAKLFMQTKLPFRSDAHVKKIKGIKIAILLLKFEQQQQKRKFQMMKITIKENDSFSIQIWFEKIRDDFIQHSCRCIQSIVLSLFFHRMLKREMSKSN